MSTDLDQLFAKPEKPSTSWMLTFADLLSLILTFFVMLYAMSNAETQRYQSMAESLAQRLNPTRQETTFELSAEKSITKVDRRVAKDLSYLHGIIKDKLKSQPELTGIVVKRLDDRVAISLASDTMFNAGEAKLSSRSAETLALLSEVLGSINNKIEVTGHTDPEPSGNDAYPSNWELSLSRAVTIANALKRSGYQYNIDIVGMGDSRYNELAPLLNAEARHRLARRVDIIVRETVADE